MDEIGEGRATRAESDGNTGSDTNLNELLEADDKFTRIKQKYKNNPEYPGLNVTIPGYPGADGWYHVRFEDRGEVHHFKTEKEILEHMSKDASISKGDLYPAGDVTNEEILYVSRWFREHPNPGRIQVDWKNYFFQSISMDYDREEDPVGSGKRHGKRIVERTVSEYQEEDGEWHDVVRNDLNYSTNYLQAKGEGDRDFDRDNEADNFEGWDDINNFNEGEYITNFGIGEKADLNPDDQGNENLHRFIMLFLGSGTLDFAWKNSFDGKWYNNWALVHLDFTIKQTYNTPNATCDLHPGNKCISHHYNGLYLAFDWEMHKAGDDKEKKSDYEADGYYSNWILKISSADPETETIPDGEPDYTKYRRIMCEDLGNTNDFDFNDLVFDVHYTGTKAEGYTANIKVQAAGGTLPIYIGEIEDAHEAHHILGGKKNSNGKYTPIINKENHIDAEEITITGLLDTDPDNVKIYVANEGDKEAVREIKLPANQGGQYENPGSNVPQKICVPYGTPWTNEHQQIETLYPTFRDWVENHDNEFWVDNGDSNTEDQRPGTPDADPELTVTYNGTTINNQDQVPITAGEKIEILCTSPNSEEIFLNVQQGTPAAISYEWDDIEGILYVTALDVEKGEQVTIFFKQEANGTTAEKQFTIIVTPRPTGEFFRWVDGSPLNITLGDDPAVVYFETSSNEKIEATVENNNNFVSLSTDIVSELTGYYKYALTITTNKVGDGKIIIKQGAKSIDLQVKVMEKVDYEKLYGTPIGNSNNPSVENYTDYSQKLQCLIDVKNELPESGNIEISFIYEETWGMSIDESTPIGGFKKPTEPTENLTFGRENLNISIKFINDSAPTYNVITMKGDAAKIRELYDYLNCKHSNGNFKGAYLKNTSSAKKRTISRK